MRAAVLMALAALAAGGPAAARAPDWRVYADCAAAYLANARIADPRLQQTISPRLSAINYLPATGGAWEWEYHRWPKDDQAKSLFNSSLRASLPARLAAAVVSK